MVDVLVPLQHPETRDPTSGVANVTSGVSLDQMPLFRCAHIGKLPAQAANILRLTNVTSRKPLLQCADLNAESATDADCTVTVGKRGPSACKNSLCSTGHLRRLSTEREKSGVDRTAFVT